MGDPRRTTAKFSELFDIGLENGTPAFNPRTFECFAVMGDHLDRGLNQTMAAECLPDDVIHLLPDFPESDYSKQVRAKLDEWLEMTAKNPELLDFGDMIE